MWVYCDFIPYMKATNEILKKNLVIRMVIVTFVALNFVDTGKPVPESAYMMGSLGRVQVYRVRN